MAQIFPMDKHDWTFGNWRMYLNENLMHNFMDTLFDPTEYQLSDYFRFFERSQFRLMLDTLKDDIMYAFKLDDTERLIGEILKRFPKGESKKAIQTILKLLGLGYDTAFCVNFGLNMDGDVEYAFRKMFKQEYPNLASQLGL